VPLAELRRRFADDCAVTDRELASLARDPRAGARVLADVLRARRARERAEDERLAALFALEVELCDRHARIAGVDEVGMGPLAGPVIAAAVVLPPGARPRGLRDSKQLSRAERERLARELRAQAVGAAIGVVTPREIDRINIYQAGLLAMKRAIEKLVPAPDFLLIDARRLAKLDIPQQAIVKGDSKVGSIAAASIVAKVERDRRMTSLALRYPGYGFEQHKGYATEDHLRALAERGPSPIHRRSFAPVRQAAATEPEPVQGDLF